MSAQFDDLKPRVLTALGLVLAFGAALYLGGVWFLALVLLTLGVAIWELTRLLPPAKEPVFFAIATAVMCFAAYGLYAARAESLALAFWVICVVIATDVAGYFAGRILGGPKFWPAVSPKKTWSGTTGGWVAAAIVSVLFLSPLGGGLGLILSGVFLAFASQMGDVVESALKRRAGVKDASDILPGHGGVLDRFDGMLGAAFAFSILSILGIW